MQLKLTNLYLYAFLALCFVGCRGCSCNPPATYVLETIVQEIQLDSGFVARIKIEHLEKKGMGFTFKFKKHGNKSSYAVRYNLQINDRPWRDEVFEHDAEKTDSMSQHRHDISLKLSEDQQHILVKCEDHPIGVYHLLAQGMPFTTTVEPDKVKKLVAAFNNKSLPNPVDIMVDYVSQVEDMASSYNNKYIKQTLNAQEIPSPLDMKLLEFIGLPLVDDYYSHEIRANHLAYNDKDWREKASKKVYRFVGEVTRAKNPIPKEVMQKGEGSINLFVHGLSNYMDKRSIDRQVLPQYPFYPYAVTLYKKVEDRTLRKQEVKIIEKNCLRVLHEDAFRKTLPNEKEAAEEAIEFLVRYRDDKNMKVFEAMIAAVFRLPILQLDVKNMDSEILFPYDTRFTEEEQKIILSHARALAKQIPEGENHFDLERFLKKIDGVKDSLPEKKEKNPS